MNKDQPPARKQTSIPLQTTNPQTLAVICLSLTEVIRTCMNEVIRLAGPEHGLQLKKRLIQQIKNSGVTGLPMEQEADALTAVIGIVDNLTRFHDDAGHDVEGKP